MKGRERGRGREGKGEREREERDHLYEQFLIPCVASGFAQSDAAVEC